jgi:hypothetical protein
MNKILWNSIKSPLRYFWVPAGEDVFAGEYQIENGDGEEASVSLESLIPFEIDGEQAEEIMLGELENMTSELGDLFKGLFSLGKRMVNAERMDEDSDSDSDWDSEDDSDWDSEDDSDEDSDSDFDDADLEKVISLFDLNSEDDSDEDSEEDADPGSIEDILSQFGEDIEGPLTELRDLLVKEFGNLGEELDKLGAQAAEELDAEPGAGQDILRELGHWLINLADEKAEDQEEDVVVMEFKPKDDQADNQGDTTDEMSVENQEDPEEDSDSSSEEISKQTDSEQENSQEDDEENASGEVDRTTESDTSEPVVESETALPNSTALKKMTKAQLVKLGGTFGMTLSMKDTKNTLLEQLETLR